MLLPFIIQNDAFFEFAVENSAGSLSPRVKWEHLANYEIDLPSMDEQRKLASLLWAAYDLKESYQRLLNASDEMAKSRFIEMFGDPVTNPKGFPMFTINNIISFQGGSQPDKSFFEFEATPENIRLIQIRDYKTDRYKTYIPRSMAKRFCSADDIMIGRYGPPIFQILQGIEGSFNVALMKATPKKGNREFIRFFLKQDCLLRYLEKMAKRTAGQDGIQMDKLKAYPFPYPPITLQNEFAAFIEELDKSKVVAPRQVKILSGASYERKVPNKS